MSELVGQSILVKCRGFILLHSPEEIGKLYELVSDTTYEKLEIWSEGVLFTWQWWIGVALTIVPWLLWIIFRKKESTLRFLTVGFFVMFISTFFRFCWSTVRVLVLFTCGIAINSSIFSMGYNIDASCHHGINSI